MSYDNAKACAVVETTDVGSNLIESTPHRIQPEVILPNQPSEEKSHFGGICTIAVFQYHKITCLTL